MDNSSEFIVLFKSSLPENLSYEEIESKCNQELLKINPKMALGGVLANSIFDEEAYLSINQDVADAGIDPIFHYLSHGLYEHRKFQILGIDSDDTNTQDLLDVTIKNSQEDDCQINSLNQTIAELKNEIALLKHKMRLL